MKTQKYIRKRLNFAGLLGVLALFLTSCATQNSATVGETDGIYAQNDPNPQYTEEGESMNSYYKQYFQSKDKEYEDIPEENAIFTDVEAYSTQEYVDEDGYIVSEERQYEGGNGPWGTNADNVTVNIYETGFNNWGWGGFGWGAGWGWGFGWNNWGWNNPYWSVGFGWGNPYWYGGGFYNPWWYGGGFYNPWWYGGGFYGNNFYNPYYYNNYYGNSVAYNRGRRNIDYVNGRSTTRSNRSSVDTRGRSNVSERGRASYSRSELNRRINNRNAQRVRGNANSVRGNNSSRTIRNNRSINTRRATPNRVNRSSGNNRSYSRPSTTRRSSGSVRSSGGSMRSSGGASRSGGGSRGRGGRG